MENNEFKESDETVLPDERAEGAELSVKVPFKVKLENYWYHYKWHTIAAIFVLIVAVVIIMSCTRREKYDVYILYAGDKAVSTSKSNPERQNFLNAFDSVASDFDGNGEVNAAFKHLYQPDEEEIARLRELEKTGDGEVPESLIREDSKLLDNLLIQSEYYLLLLDKEVFDRCCKRGVISACEKLLPDGFDGEIVKGDGGGSGIWLKDTGFSQLEGVNTLPDDVVVCVKLGGAMASDDAIELREDAIEVFKAIART